MAIRRRTAPLVHPLPIDGEGVPRRPLDDRTPIQALQDQVGSVPTTTSRDRVASPRTDRKQFRLGEGNHRLSTASASDRVDVYGGGAADTDIITNVTVTAPVTYFSGCRFLGTVTVPATSVVFFTGCELTKEISVANGGHVHLTGCHLSGTAAVNNAGAAINCYITNCHKTSTAAHTNVTVISETT